MTRMNLNTFQRHGVFEDEEVTALIANRLRNPRLIEQARVFPYQLMAAYTNASSERAGGGSRGAAGRDGNRASSNVPRVDREGVRLPGRVGFDALADHRSSARARRRRCVASTWRPWWPRRCCGAIRRRK